MAERKRKSNQRSAAPAAEAPAPVADEPTQAPARSERRKAAPDPGAEAPETRAHALLPPPAPVPPARRVGPRRVVGHDTAERLLARRGFRPAGNSRRFWARVEEDDPFLARPGSAPAPVAADEAYAVSPGRGAHEPAAAERLTRVQPAAKAAKPAPRAEPRPAEPRRAEPRPAEPRAAEPRAAEPRAAAPRPSTPPPRPPQAAPRPAPPQARPAPPAPASQPPPGPPVDRRPPLIRNAHLGEGAAPAPREPEPTVRQRLVDASGRSATEVRREREQARAGNPGTPPPRGFDEVMALMSQLRASEDLYKQGLKDEATEAFQPEELAPRAPGRPAPRSVAPAAPAPRPAPPPPAVRDEPVDSGPIDRSPRKASGQASLDDLFGGGEGRVKIGRRTVPRPASDE